MPSKKCVLLTVIKLLCSRTDPSLRRMANGSSAQEIRVFLHQNPVKISSSHENKNLRCPISNFDFYGQTINYSAGADKSAFPIPQIYIFFFYFVFYFIFLNHGCDFSRNDLRLFMSFCWANSCTIKARQQQVFDEPWKCWYLAPKSFLVALSIMYNTFVTKMSLFLGILLCTSCCFALCYFAHWIMLSKTVVIPFSAKASPFLCLFSFLKFYFFIFESESRLVEP